MGVHPKTKVLLVAHGAGPGGGDRYVFDQAKLLLKLGFDVSCISFQGGLLETAYREQGIACAVEPVSRMDDQTIYRLVKDCDIVIANTMWAIFFTYVAQKYKPTMLILHDCPSFMENLFARVPTTQTELNRIRHLLGVSPYHVKMLKKAGQADAQLLNNFVPDTCPPMQRKTENEKLKFLTAANWSVVKGYDLALNAFRCLAEEEKERIEWHIAGQMENDRACRSFQENAATEPWVYFHGLISDKKCLHNLYSECDVYLQMSREDSCPLAVVDAAMLRMPMIVSKDTGSNYLAENGAGWIVDEYDSASVTEAMRLALNQREKLQEMGMRARKNYLANATPEIYARALTEKINKMMEEDRLLLLDRDESAAEFSYGEAGRSR